MDFYKFLLDSSITTLIMNESDIKQIFLDLFIHKAKENQTKDFIISNCNNLMARKFKVSNNLYVFLTKNSVVNNKIENCFKK